VKLVFLLTSSVIFPEKSIASPDVIRRSPDFIPLQTSNARTSRFEPILKKKMKAFFTGMMMFSE